MSRPSNFSSVGFSEAELEAKWDDYNKSLPDVDVKPQIHDAWATHGVFQVVGNGLVTNPDPEDPKQCGRYYGNNGCVHTELHDKVTFDKYGHLVNHKGMAYIRKRFRYCFNARCPTCYKAWASREARRAEARILKVKKCFGLPEHIVISVPKSDYDRLEADIGWGRKRAVEVAESVGVMGAGLIWHGFRFANKWTAKRKNIPYGFYWNPHWHLVGFLKDDYSRCRGCDNTCEGFKGVRKVIDTERCLKCEGFEGRVRRKFNADVTAFEEKHGETFDSEGRKRKEGGWIVSVKGRRESIWGTFYYQLNHCTVLSDSKGFHSLTWFGVVSYTNLKLEDGDFVESPRLCPICQSELVPLTYFGFEMARFEKEFWIKSWEEPCFDRDGLPIWIEKVSGKHRYCGGE